VVSMLLMIGQCQFCGEEQVAVPLAVHNPFNMPNNNDATTKKINQASNVSPLSDYVARRNEIIADRKTPPTKTSSALQFDTSI